MTGYEVEFYSHVRRIANASEKIANALSKQQKTKTFEVSDGGDIKRIDEFCNGVSVREVKPMTLWGMNYIVVLYTEK